MVARCAHLCTDGSSQNLIEWLHTSADKRELVRLPHSGRALDVTAQKLFRLKIDPIFLV